jgi:hypothetical protein
MRKQVDALQTIQARETKERNDELAEFSRFVCSLQSIQKLLGDSLSVYQKFCDAKINRINEDFILNENAISRLIIVFNSNGYYK